MRATLLCVIMVGAVVLLGMSFVLVSSAPSDNWGNLTRPFSATTGTTVWWVGAESTDSSALPNTGVRGTIQVISYSVTGCLAYWVADDLTNSVWGQVGYNICSGSTPVAFYQVWSLANNTVLAGGSLSVSTGFHVFSMSLQSGTTWAFTLDGTPIGSFNMGASSSSSSYPVEAMSEEQGSGVFSIPEVDFSPALQALKSGSWSSVSTATSYGTSWGIEGNAQNSSLGTDEIIVGGSLPTLSQGTNLWSSGSTTTASSTTFPPTTTVTSTVTSTFDTTLTDTTTSTATTTVTQTTTSTSTASTTSTQTSTKTSTSTVTSTLTSTSTSTATSTTTLTKTDTSTTTSTASTTATSTSTVTSTATQTTTSTTTSTATTTVTTGPSPTTTVTVTTTATQTSTGTSPTTTVTITSPGPTTTVTSTQTSVVTSPTTVTVTVTRDTILTVSGPTLTTTVTDSKTKTVTDTTTVTSTQPQSATSSSTSPGGTTQQGSGTGGAASLIPVTPFEVLLIGVAVGVGGVLVGVHRTLTKGRNHDN